MSKATTNNKLTNFSKWVSFELFVFLLFFIIQYLPQFESFDPMGPQWLGLAILNIGIFIYFHFFGEKYLYQLHAIFNHKTSILYLIYVVWALMSIFYAFNKIETWVTLSRLLITFISFLHFSIIFSTNKKVLIPLSYAVSIIVFGEAIVNINKFLTGIQTSDIDTTILSLSGTSGNKNIYAQSLLFKMPFVVYSILNAEKIYKYIFGSIFCGGLTLLLLVNARSTFVGLILMSILFILFIFLKRDSIIWFFKQLLFYVIPIVLAVLLTTLLINYARETRKQLGGSANSGFAAPLERVKDITFEQSGRTSLWLDGIQYAISHPLLGAGYGNWKIFSSRGDRDNEYYIPYHVHNDFIEITAELGFIGGLLFISLFFLIAFDNIKTAFIKVLSFKDVKIYLLIVMLLACYFSDAFFNFPIERPVMQIYFALLMALAVVFYYHQKKEANKIKGIYTYYKLFLLLALINVFYTTYNNYKSLVMQNMLNAYGEQNVPEDVLNGFYATFSPIPNLNYAAQPVDAILAKYYAKLNKYDIAFELLERSKNDNPNIYINDYFLGYMFATQNKLDSSFKYNKIAFYGRPRNSGVYSNLTVSCMQFKDSVELDKAFGVAVKLRNEPYVWYHYLGAKYELGGRKSTDYLKKMVDSSLKLHPKIDSSYNLQNIRSLIYGTIENKEYFIEKSTISYENNKVYVKGNFSENTVNFLNLYKDSATNAFMKADYKNAIRLFKIASSLDAKNYAYYENIGICYFSMNDFATADNYFTKSINLGGVSGKSELYKGVSLIQLGNVEKGCKFLYLAKSRNFTEVNPDEQIKLYCK